MKYLKSFQLFESDTYFISWETIKKNCVHEMWSKLRSDFDIYPLLSILRLKEYQETGTAGKGSHQWIRELCEKLEKAINTTDIREYEILTKNLPKAFPKWILDGKYSIELTDSGWGFVRK